MEINEKVNLIYSPGDSVFYLIVPYSLKDRVKEIGGKWTQSLKAWMFPVDENIWNSIRETFGGKGNLLVQKSFLRELDRIRENQKKFNEMRALAEDDNPVDYEVKGISLDGKNPFFNYQKWGVKCGILAEDGFLIGDQPGLGKALEGLGIAIERRNLGEIDNCLIVCLASLKYNWLNEIAKFTKEKALVVDGQPDERRKKWQAKGYFFKIANYETIVGDLFVDTDPKRKTVKNLSSDEISWRKQMQRQFDMVIVDEIHAIKHHSSQRTQALKQIKARYRLGLSGTPVDGRLEELHSIFGFLKPGLFESRSKFMEHHAILDHFGSVKGYIGVNEVREKILPYYIRRVKERVLKDLPEKIFKDVYVDLAPMEKRVYKELISGAHEITDEEMAATRILRVRQFLDFPELLDLRNRSWKFNALSDLLEELVDGNQEKCLIFTQYKEVLDLLVMNLKDKYNILQIHGGVDSKERFNIVEQFNNDKKWNLLIGTDAMSTGLNIGGANACLHYDEPYSPAVFNQRCDRAHRATTKHNVTIYRFVCKDTVEEKVRKILNNKMDLNNAVLDESNNELGVTTLTNLDLLKYL